MELSESLKTEIEALVNSDNESWLHNTYIYSYPSLIAFFTGKEIKEENLIQGAHLVYGWMPTILKIRNNQGEKIPSYELIKECCEIIKKLKSEFPTRDQILILRNLTNNSVVGLSKLLHFIYPDKFPIWDSRISSKVNSKSDWQNVNKPEYFIEYIEFMRSDECKRAGQDIKGKISNKLNKDFYGPTFQLQPMRALEMTIFQLADKKITYTET